MLNPTITGSVTLFKRTYTTAITIATYDIISDLTAYVAERLTAVCVAAGVTESGATLVSVEQTNFSIKGDVRYYVCTVTVTT